MHLIRLLRDCDNLIRYKKRHNKVNRPPHCNRATSVDNLVAIKSEHITIIMSDIGLFHHSVLIIRIKICIDNNRIFECIQRYKELLEGRWPTKHLPQILALYVSMSRQTEL